MASKEVSQKGRSGGTQAVKQRSPGYGSSISRVEASVSHISSTNTHAVAYYVQNECLSPPNASFSRSQPSWSPYFLQKSKKKGRKRKTRTEQGIMAPVTFRGFKCCSSSVNKGPWLLLGERARAVTYVRTYVRYFVPSLLRS